MSQAEHDHRSESQVRLPILPVGFRVIRWRLGEVRTRLDVGKRHCSDGRVRRKRHLHELNRAALRSDTPRAIRPKRASPWPGDVQSIPREVSLSAAFRRLLRNRSSLPGRFWRVAKGKEFLDLPAPPPPAPPLRYRLGIVHRRRLILHPPIPPALSSWHNKCISRCGPRVTGIDSPW